MLIYFFWTKLDSIVLSPEEYAFSLFLKEFESFMALYAVSVTAAKATFEQSKTHKSNLTEILFISFHF